MSFHWNLSSDEEDEDQGLEELWKKAHEDQNRELEQQQQGQQQDDNDGAAFSFEDMFPSGPGPAVAKLPSSGFNDFEDGGGDSSSVDWEDAAEDAEDVDDGVACNIAIPKTKRQPLTAVTVDLDQKPAASDTKKRQKKARKQYRHGSLPDHLQSLLDNLHKTHLLALTSHALFNSSQCSDELLLSIAHSLIPPNLVWDSLSTNDKNKEAVCGPALCQLRNFCQRFLDLVNNAEERRQQTLRANQMAGAPRMARQATRRKRSAAQESSVSTSLESHAGSSTQRLLEYCSYLAMTQSEDPQIIETSINTNEWTNADKLGLLIAMARSMGWRARYAVAVEPAKKDLDMHHPIFKSATVNVFQAIATWNRPTTTKKKLKGKVEVIDVDEVPQEGNPKKKQKRPLRQSEKEENVPSNDAGQRDTQLFASEGDTVQVGWVEILCCMDNVRRAARKQPQEASKDGSSSKPTMRWVHVDPNLKAIDDPGRVESYLFELQQQREQQTEGYSSNRQGLKKRSSGGGSAKKRKPVAYVVAVEHCSDGDSQQQKRITDVTPRYASSMVESMKLRGITHKQQAKLLSNQVGTWWSNTIKALNFSFKGSPAAQATKNSPGSSKEQSGKTIEAAIDMLSDDDETTKDKNQSVDAHDEEEDAVDSLEKEELAKSVKKEALPTSKEKFKNHPLYVIQSILKKTEVLAPDAKKHICGIFKGEMVYSRSDVSEARAEKKWLYQGRKVRKNELKKPIKRVKARAKASKGGAASFKALSTYGVGKENDGSSESEKKQLELASKPLDDGMQDLYAIWQTDPWSPPYVAPSDPIPVNEYNNVELELLNPGLTHIPEPGIAPVAKQLGIPYAPCLLGFEGHNGNRTPTIRGIVVHNHNAELLREASVEVVSRSVEQEHEKRRKAVYSRWKRLLVGILTQDRLEREYGD